LLTAFTRYLTAAGKAAGTIEQRVGDIRRLSGTFRDLNAVTKDDLERYLADRRETWSPNYRRRVLSSIAIYYRWAKREGRIRKNPARRLESFKVPRGIPRPAPEEVILDAFDRAPLPVRAMLCLAASCMFRRSEIAHAHPRDREGKTLRTRGKGNKTRIVPLDSLTLALLVDLERLQGTDTHYFPGGSGTGHLHPATVYKRMKYFLGEQWGPHSLRHRGASEGLRRTRDLRGVQEFLGHSSPDTTQIYTLVGAEDLQAISDATSLSDQIIRRRLSAVTARAPASASNLDISVYQAIQKLDEYLEDSAS
jgi:site-specific recombinase XerD